MKKPTKQAKITGKTCTDNYCPKHGKVSLRGKEFVGKVVSSRMQKTVVLEWNRVVYVKKYERYLTKRSKVHAHNSSCIGAAEGDTVKIKECRPISKTKSFIVTEIIESNK